jgi:insertion element IS1 protein InsB
MNQAVLQHLPPEHVEVEIGRADALEVRHGLSSELDEMGSYVQSKAHPRWLWHAIDHHTGKVLAYVCGRRQDTVFIDLQALLEPFGITRYCTDEWGADERHLDTAQHHVGKTNTQKIESKHIHLKSVMPASAHLLRRSMHSSMRSSKPDVTKSCLIASVASKLSGLGGNNSWLTCGREIA